MFLKHCLTQCDQRGVLAYDALRVLDSFLRLTTFGESLPSLLAHGRIYKITYILEQHALRLPGPDVTGLEFKLFITQRRMQRKFARKANAVEKYY